MKTILKSLVGAVILAAAVTVAADVSVAGRDGGGDWLMNGLNSNGIKLNGLNPNGQAAQGQALRQIPDSASAGFDATAVKIIEFRLPGVR